MAEINQLIDEIALALCQRGWRLVTVESCTGGLLAAELTSRPGSSEWFEGAFVTYRLSAKQRMVGVAESLLDRHGAVSEPTARAMAEGALNHCDADISVAITGVAGPGGGELQTPVGTVWFAWALRDLDAVTPGKPATAVCAQASEHQFRGNRDTIRQRAVVCALDGIQQLLRSDVQDRK